jgi:hypothetical protein
MRVGTSHTDCGADNRVCRVETRLDATTALRADSFAGYQPAPPNLPAHRPANVETPGLELTSLHRQTSRRVSTRQAGGPRHIGQAMTGDRSATSRSEL